MRPVDHGVVVPATRVGRHQEQGDRREPGAPDGERALLGSAALRTGTSGRTPGRGPSVHWTGRRSRAAERSSARRGRRPGTACGASGGSGPASRPPAAWRPGRLGAEERRQRRTEGSRRQQGTSGQVGHGWLRPVGNSIGAWQNWSGSPTPTSPTGWGSGSRCRTRDAGPEAGEADRERRARRDRPEGQAATSSRWSSAVRRHRSCRRAPTACEHRRARRARALPGADRARRRRDAATRPAFA